VVLDFENVGKGEKIKHIYSRVNQPLECNYA